jgi:uncharacterized membrane protein
VKLTSIDGALWAVSLGGQLLLLAVLARQRLYRLFPVFFFYVLYSSLSDVVFFRLFGSLPQGALFRAFFVNDAVEFLLQIGILLEVGLNVVSPVRRSLPRAALYLLGGMIATAAVVALLFSFHSPDAQFDRWSRYFIAINFAVAILRLAIFAAIAGFAQLLGIGWKNHVLQIATGFLGYTVATLMVELLHRATGVGNQPLYHLHEQFRIIGWCMVLGYWSYALSRKEAPRKEFSPKMANFLVSIAEGSRSGRPDPARQLRK